MTATTLKADAQPDTFTVLPADIFNIVSTAQPVWAYSYQRFTVDSSDEAWGFTLARVLAFASFKQPGYTLLSPCALVVIGGQDTIWVALGYANTKLFFDHPPAVDFRPDDIPAALPCEPCPFEHEFVEVNVAHTIR